MLRLFTVIISVVLIWGCTSSSQIKYYQEAPKEFAKFYATGYAPINSQTGDNQTQKILQAIKASKLEAYRELTAQVHGHQIDSQTQLRELMIADSSLNASVRGLIRGAKVVKSYPVSDEIYATELELDYKNLYLLYNSTAMPRRVINE